MGILSEEEIIAHVLPIFLKSCKDPVANVRLFTAKLLKEIIPKLNKTIIENKIKPTLLEMTKDSDRDAKYFAKEAFDIC